MHDVKRFRFYLVTVLLFSSTVFASGPGKLVLIVDDLGNQYRSGVDALSLPWVTTVAIMPARPFSEKLAVMAHERGKEVIIHAPMSNSIDFPLGALGLDRNLGYAQMMDNVRSSIASVPYAVGLSNHMGSRLTQDRQAMNWLMAELKAQGLYFFDSRTVSTTKAWEAARSARIPWSMRDYFLDHFREHDFMASQWQLAVERVLKGENITVICHPYPETLDFLEKLTLTQVIQDALVPLSDVLNYPKETPMRFNVRNIPEGAW